MLNIYIIEFVSLEELEPLKQIKSLKIIHIGQNPLLSLTDKNQINKYFDNVEIKY